MLPWLLSISLLSVPKFAVHTGPSILSRDLQAPALPLTSSILTSRFSSMHVRKIREDGKFNIKIIKLFLSNFFCKKMLKFETHICVLKIYDIYNIINYILMRANKSKLFIYL